MKKQISLIGKSVEEKQNYYNLLMSNGYRYKLDWYDDLKNTTPDTLGIDSTCVGFVVDITNKNIITLMHRKLNSLASYETLTTNEFSKRYIY